MYLCCIYENLSVQVGGNRSNHDIHWAGMVRIWIILVFYYFSILCCLLNEETMKNVKVLFVEGRDEWRSVKKYNWSFTEMMIREEFALKINKNQISNLNRRVRKKRKIILQRETILVRCAFYGVSRLKQRTISNFQ